MDRREFLRLSAGAAALSMASSAARAAHHAKQSVQEIPVVLECAINGSTTKAKNPAAPETVEEHIAEVGRCFDAGVTIVHTHSNQPNPDPAVAAKFYLDVFGPVRKKHPHGIVYATANFDPKTYHQTREVWPSAVQCEHHRILAAAGAANMVLLDMGVVAIGGYDEQGAPREAGSFWYGFWPEDTGIILDICRQHGTGTSISVFEPGWMKNVVAMARGGALPRGSKVNIYFAGDGISSMAPPIPEALELYLKMMEGLDLKWSVGVAGGTSVMDTPLARMALERGGSFRVGLEDWGSGPSNLEQIARAMEIIASVGRRVVSGPEAVEYLDIPFAPTRP